jgi:hypothetical protein
LDQFFLDPEATRDDHLAVLGERLADGVEGFLDRRVDEAAGVDDDEVRAGVALRRLVALGAQLGEDALGIYQGLRTAERNEPDSRTSRRLFSDQRGSPGR